MKKLTIIFAVIGLISVLFATTMTVHTTTGEQEFEISEITSITFNSGGASNPFTDDFENQSLSNWVIGGRQEGTNEASVVMRNGSYSGYLYQAQFTEITLEKDLPLDNNMTFNFDMETEVNSEAGGTSDFYATAGVWFYFYNDNDEIIGRVAYIKSTSTYAFNANSNPDDNINEITANGNQSYSFTMNELLNQITPTGDISYVKLMFKPYTSGWPYNMWGKVWIDNVDVSW